MVFSEISFNEDEEGYNVLVWFPLVDDYPIDIGMFVNLDIACRVQAKIYTWVANQVDFFGDTILKDEAIKEQLENQALDVVTATMKDEMGY